MKYKIYIQSMNGFPIADWAVSAYLGFREKQADIVFFEEIEEVPLSKNNIVVAFIEDINKYFAKLGLPPKQALNIPQSIIKYAGRDIIEGWNMSLFKRSWEQFPIFIKPAGRAKEWVAGVVKNKGNVQAYFKDVIDESPIFLSEVVNFVSEYRGYVINGELKGIKHYLGNFRIFPDVNIIDSAIHDYENAPAGYAIDFGITDSGKTLLIECNDGWSLGNYGLNDVTYSTLLAARWLELMKEI